MTMTSKVFTQVTGDDPYFFTDHTDGDDFVYVCGTSTTEEASAGAPTDSADEALTGNVGDAPPDGVSGDPLTDIIEWFNAQSPDTLSAIAPSVRASIETMIAARAGDAPHGAPGDIVGPPRTNNGDLGNGDTADWWDELWNDSPPLGGVGSDNSGNVKPGAGFANAPSDGIGFDVALTPSKGAPAITELELEHMQLAGGGKLQGLGNQWIEHVDSKHVDNNAAYPNAPGQAGGLPVQYQPNPTPWGGNDHVPLKLQWAASTGGEWATTHAIELSHLGSSIAPNSHDLIM
jgi:hypothetical protein